MPIRLWLYSLPLKEMVSRKFAGAGLRSSLLVPRSILDIARGHTNPSCAEINDFHVGVPF